MRAKSSNAVFYGVVRALLLVVGVVLIIVLFFANCLVPRELIDRLLVR